MDMRTPLAKVRGLGSAHEGADHFWRQRLTAVANVPLVLFLVWMLITHVGADHATVAGFLGQPLVAVIMVMLLLSAAIHMRIGMQVVIVDYVHGEGL